MMTPVLRWFGLAPRLVGLSIHDLVAGTLRKRSTRRIMLEAADLIEASGSETDRAIATVLRERAFLMGQEGGPDA